jgi:hypothetical protein
MKKLSTVVLLIAFIFCVKCKSNTHKKVTNNETKVAVTINGVWKSIGYGRIVNITDETVA